MDWMESLQDVFPKTGGLAYLLTGEQSDPLLVQAGLCLLLEYYGTASLTITWDGVGDSGNLEVTESEAFEFADPEVVVPEWVVDIIEEAVSRTLPGGCEINDGSYGTFIFNVEDRSVEIDFTWNEPEADDEDEFEDEFEDEDPAPLEIP